MTRAELRRLREQQAVASVVEGSVVESPVVEGSVVADVVAASEETPVVAPQHTEPTNGPIPSLAETVVAEATALTATATLRRRDRAAANPGVSTLIDTNAAAALPLSFVAAHADPCLVDEFERAARLLSFTGQTPIQTDPVAEPPAAVVHVAPRRRRISFKRVAATSFSLGVMSIVGLLAVGTTLPASAISAAGVGADLAAVAPAPEATENIQAYVSSTNGDSTLDRSSEFDVASMADIAADSGVTQFAGTWVSDPSAAIQWPFPVGVPISAAYGSQSYLSKFSSPHRGVDLTPGTGAEVHVIADGTVRIATEAGGDYGVTVVVDHVIDGRLVSTRYAHMQYGSLQVSQGDTVSVGDVLGRVGQTGKATGPHLHFEVLLDGTTHTDPIAWMTQHTEG